MNAIVKGFDSLPKIVKIILALPVLDVVWAIYRIIRSLAKKSFIATLLSILMLILCPTVFWIVDLITIIFLNKVLWLV